MLRSISTASLGGGLKEKLYAIAAAGFSLVELSEYDLLTSDLSPREIRQFLDDVGLSVSMFSELSDFEAVSERTLKKSVHRAEKKFELMSEINAPLLLVTASVRGNSTGTDEILARQLQELAERGSPYEIRIACDVKAAAGCTRGTGDGWRIIESMNHPGIGLVLNSFEVLAGDAVAVSQLQGDSIFMVRLADAPALPLDIVTLGQHFQSFPGQGTLDVAGFAAQIIETGYSGPFSLHVLNEEVRTAPVRQSALDAMRSLTYVEEQLYRRGRKTSVSLFANADPPPQPARESIGFIEFAVSAESRHALGGWLQALGFSKVGYHRSKAVYLYRQKDVLVVLNSGTDTFAHVYHRLHGTSVCAIGLRLPDPNSLLERADLYRYKRYEERRTSQEYEMPAVRAPDGSLIHLLGDDYDPARDFTVQDFDSVEPTGIQRIDHIARAVPPGEINTWTLFYRAMLFLEPGTSLSIPDPHGLVSSTELHDQSRELRLPLTSSANCGTVIAESLTNYGGAGINQIAFEADDIFSSISAIRENGLRLLEVPSNYYRALEADRDVSHSLAERFEEFGVLYDRDERGGEFFHAYTEVFEGRFFFEIVQRTGGYDRYGEVNSPVRLALQSDHHPQQMRRQNPSRNSK